MLSQSEKRQLKQTIKANKHEVYVVSFDEMDAIVRSKGTLSEAQATWSELKGKIEFGANYYATGSDIMLLRKLVSDLGSVTTKAYIKTYAGKPHIILKGYPGLRNVLTGTRYGIAHPKVITMGLGKTAVTTAVKSGGLLTVFLLTGYRIVDYFLTDQFTLSQLIGRLATDVVKVGVTVGASIAFASIIAGSTLALAIGPLVVAIVIGLAVSFGLTWIDDYYGITDSVVAGLDEMGNDVDGYMKQIRQNTRQQIDTAVDSVFDYAIESAQRIFVNMARHYTNRFFRNRQRIY